MPIGNKEHCRVTMTVSVVLCDVDKLFNLGFGQVLAASKFAVRPASRGNCSFLDGWLHQPQVRFCCHFSPPFTTTARTIGIIRAVCKAVMRLTWPRSACGSFRLNACELDYLGPLRSFLGDQLAVVGRRPWQRRASQIG